MSSVPTFDGSALTAREREYIASLESQLLAARRDADAARDAWMRVAAAWMRWADETLGDSPFGDEPSGMTRAALATPATSHSTTER